MNDIKISDDEKIDTENLIVKLNSGEMFHKKEFKLKNLDQKVTFIYEINRLVREDRHFHFNL